MTRHSKDGRWRWVAVALALLLVVAGGTAYVVGHRSPDAAPRHAAVPPAPRTLALAAATPDGSVAGTPSGVARALRAALHDPAFGGSLTAEVVDQATGTTLLDRNAATPMTPASTVKVLTAAAALATLGPQARLHTHVLREGRSLFLVGGGDVTLLARPPSSATYPRPADLAALARSTAHGLPPQTGFRLCADVSAWTGSIQAPGWTPSYVRGGDISLLSPLEVGEARLSTSSSERSRRPAAQALTAFAAALRAEGVSLAIPARGCPVGAPAAALPVASVGSPPVEALVGRMLTVSDNDLAEALGRAVAAASGQPSSFAGEAAALVSSLRTLNVEVTGLRLFDASGLSRLDRVTASTLVSVLRAAMAQPRLRPLLAGLPVAGATGTLQERYRVAPAVRGAGVVRAKTGTLAGVNALAGLTIDADGRLLVFALLTDRAASPSRAEAALDRVAAALAACGCT